MRLPKKRTERKLMRVFLWVLFVFAVFFAVFLTGSMWQVWQKERETRVARDAALNEYAELVERKEHLTKKISALQTERGVEEELRNRFMVAGENEHIIILVDATTSSFDTGEESTPFSLWEWIRSSVWFLRD